MSKPYPWHPDIIDIQMATIGSLAILAIPGELTYVSYLMFMLVKKLLHMKKSLESRSVVAYFGVKLEQL